MNGPLVSPAVHPDNFAAERAVLIADILAMDEGQLRELIRRARAIGILPAGGIVFNLDWKEELT